VAEKRQFPGFENMSKGKHFEYKHLADLSLPSRNIVFSFHISLLGK